MPFQRRYSRRKRFTRKRQFRRKFNRRGMVRRSRKGYSVYRFKRTTQTVFDINSNAVISADGSLPQNQGTGMNTAYYLGFRLSDLPDDTDFTNLYDQYKIKGVKVSFIPIGNVSSYTNSSPNATGGTGATTTVPGTYSTRSYTALDWNGDSTSVTTIPEIMEYQNMKWRPYNKIHTRFMYPRIAITDSQGSSLNLKNQPWLSTANDSERIHYGMIFMVDPVSGFTSSSNVFYKAEIKYYLSFRNCK